MIDRMEGDDGRFVHHVFLGNRVFISTAMQVCLPPCFFRLLRTFHALAWRFVGGNGLMAMPANQ